MKKYFAIGLMSGTSLDGVDIAYCRFIENNGKWEFDIIDATTVEYSEEWIERLTNSMKSDAESLALLNIEYGHYLGSITREFIREKGFAPDLISSHGHTIFHQPEKKLTLQIGDGAAIAAETGIPAVCDFRSTDVALGGQGAPLVPIGDKLLFSDYDYCINIGGIANISYEDKGKRIAYDICPANMALNYLSEKLGQKYDDGGRFAASGKPVIDLLSELDSLKYYNLNPPKSLGKEWVFDSFIPIIEKYSIPVQDALNTVTEHIAGQISETLQKQGKTLITGGGANNTFLINRIKEKSKTEIVIPDRTLIDFKEALIFAFMGVLRWRNEINIFSSVTGATLDHSGGAVYI
jgi:anhydro-N-acetylmuramic acid kinase